jgi:hypothetical protein
VKAEKILSRRRNNKPFKVSKGGLSSKRQRTSWVFALAKAKRRAKHKEEKALQLQQAFQDEQKRKQLKNFLDAL